MRGMCDLLLKWRDLRGAPLVGGWWLAMGDDFLAYEEYEEPGSSLPEDGTGEGGAVTAPVEAPRNELRPVDSHGIRYWHDLPTEPAPRGWHRVVKTYDDLVPVAWADVPDGQSDPKPMYLSTEAARIMMMSDAEYEEWDRQRRNDDSDWSGDGKTPTWQGLPVTAQVIAIAFLTALVEILLLFLPDAISGARLVLALVVLTTGSLAGGLCGYHAMAPKLNPGRKPSDNVDRNPLPEASDLAESLGARVRETDIGWLAERGRRQAEALPSREGATREAIGAAFSEGSLSRQRFDGTLSMMGDTVRRNLSVLLDGTDAGGMDAETQRVISGLLDDNDKLLEEMSRLVGELSLLRLREASEGSTDAVSEARKLVDETSQYRL